jgi:hypothetical protein
MQDQKPKWRSFCNSDDASVLNFSFAAGATVRTKRKRRSDVRTEHDSVKKNTRQTEYCVPMNALT